MGTEHGFIRLHDLAMANFRHLFLKRLARSLAPIKLVLSGAFFNLKVCSQAEELARRLLKKQTQTNSSKFLTSGLPLPANLIPFKGRSWWLT